MSDTDTPRRPGPWDASPDEVPAAPIEAPSPRSVSEGPPAGAQTPLAALGASVFLFGLVWLASQNWLVAVAIVWGVLIHEYGHVLAMNRVGMGPATLHFTWFGGLAKAQRLPSSEWHGVLVSLAGPAFGLLAAIPFFLLYFGLAQPVWLLGAVVIAALNLINLAPAPPLDGSKAIGPVLARIHPWVERIAILLVGALVVYWAVVTGRLLLTVFLAIALIGHFRRGFRRPEGRELTVGESFASVGLFLVTAGACAGVGLGALLLLANGSLPAALAIAAQDLGFR